ncbi:hypothetical protein [Streptomyces sp. NPDC006463]|uniref:hypothetical protein n=1 Tax=Streptomyces sp. NPDC006463 TaxID=3364746 RepID=UPI003674FDC3
MGTFVVQILIAVLGIGGPLASALLTQRSAGRARDRELRHAREVQADEREYAARQARVEAQRTCYAALSAGTRDFMNAATALLHAVEGREAAGELRAELSRARREHRMRHAEAQMLLPDAVMTAAGTANRHLGDLYDLLMRLDATAAGPEEDVAAARESMARAWDALWRMRHVMRVDLGLTASEEGPTDPA